MADTPSLEASIELLRANEKTPNKWMPILASIVDHRVPINPDMPTLKLSRAIYLGTPFIGITLVEHDHVIRLTIDEPTRQKGKDRAGAMITGTFSLKPGSSVMQWTVIGSAGDDTPLQKQSIDIIWQRVYRCIDLGYITAE